MRPHRSSVRGLMWSVLLIASVLASVRWALDGLYMVLTKFAPGVHPYRFDDRLMGQTREQVLAEHGEPLNRYEWNGQEVWIYSDNKPTSGLFWRLEVGFDGKTQRVRRFLNDWYSD